ncbi:LLM class flavin-dependent oxidoreductase [Micromonospora globispora]|uniref:LLM class flavin-dependent oxidoreductase n=1 Tax=Micromonospora globispora TaxID=1450148 RepID=UPI000D6ED0B3|nr:LLM class flavin-dependent oxidoreductase [Micromonospora globispora]PWU61084.1 LLM class flavin-dependent oxidoreductase [Micromonospora globispora]RQW98958.1 LLM class flavin-dependent oxidoreductase [Micromonospora globispora]
MHVGMGVFFQGLDQSLNDHELVTQQLSLADSAEALGFQSIWTAEHHFTNYHMMPNPAQFLTYMAARTRTVKLGTMVMVIPWHDPVRVAEEMSWLDNVSGGRAVLGLGRGLGSIEFDNFRLEMGESRQRFVEYATAISDSLESGYIESDGELYQQPRAAIKPAPYATFRGRTYASAVSPESAKIMARLGYGLMLIAQKPWQTVVAEAQQYRDLFVEINGHEPPQPVLVNYTTVHEDAGRAQEMHDEFTMAYARSTVDHYEFTNPRLQTVNGYEYYAGLSRNIEKHGLTRFNKFLADLQISGTPDSVVDQVVDRVRALNAGGVINVLAYGGMSREIAEEQTKLYARTVLPRLRAIDTHRDICIPSVPMAPVAG